MPLADGSAARCRQDPPITCQTWIGHFAKSCVSRSQCGPAWLYHEGLHGTLWLGNVPGIWRVNAPASWRQKQSELGYMAQPVRPLTLQLPFATVRNPEHHRGCAGLVQLEDDDFLQGGKRSMRASVSTWAEHLYQLKFFQNHISM